MSLTFGYWDCRGRGAAIRNLLRYVGADYKEDLYKLTDFDSWFGNKHSMGFDFPNLPYLVDGDVKLTQTNAIIRYLGRKFNLAATSDPQMGLEEMVHNQIQDLLDRMIVTVYYKQPYASDEAFANEREKLKKEFQTAIEPLEKFLESRTWFTGEKLSYVDFFAYENLDWYRELVDADCFAQRPKLAAFMKRFEELAPLKDYLASDAYRKDAIFGPFAMMGNKKKE